jgi:methionine-S-sulfoxide reductase
MSGKYSKYFLFIFILIFLPFSLFAESKYEEATFAGGCFWCMEHPFEKLEGVSEVVSGYTGGRKKNPTYREVSAGATFHFESIQITYDPSKISYSKLLDLFWRQIDPTDPDGQFADRGLQYRTAIFYHNEEQKRLAEKSKEQLDKSGRYDEQIVTEITEATSFYQAEEYHQDYYKKTLFNIRCIEESLVVINSWRGFGVKR